MEQDKKIIDGYALARSILQAGIDAHDSTAMFVAGYIIKFIDEAPEIKLEKE